MPNEHDKALLGEIIEHFAKSDETPGDCWAFPDDFSSLCFDCRMGDGTNFWIDIEKDGVKILWRRPGTEARVLRFKVNG